MSNRVTRRQAERWEVQGQQAYDEPAPAQAQAQAPASASSSIDQLKDLADLKSQGILTEEEFAAQKAKILGT